MKDIIKYLKTLDAESLHFAVSKIGSVHTNVTTGCPMPKPTSHPTPNGDWECNVNTWVWVPDLG